MCLETRLHIYAIKNLLKNDIRNRKSTGVVRYREFFGKLESHPLNFLRKRISTLTSMRRRKESDNYMTQTKTQSPFRPAKTQLSTTHHVPQPLPRSCPNPPTQKLPWKCTQNHHIHTRRQKVMQHWYRRVSNELSHRSFWLLNIKANCVSYRVAVSLGRIERSTKGDYVSQLRNWYGPKMVLTASVFRVCARI